MNIGGNTYSLPQILIGIVVIGACLALTMLALAQFGIPIPQIVWQGIGIVLVALFIIFAIRFLLASAGSGPPL